MQIIILAAGVGTRMGNLKVPKCLLPVRNTTVIEILLKTLGDLNMSDLSVRIVIGSQGKAWSRTNQQKIQKICSDILINPHNVDYENAYSLQLGLEGIHSDEVLLIDGDIFCEKKLLNEFLNHLRTDILLVRPAVNPEEKGGKIYLREGQVETIGEELPREYYPWKIYSGIARLSLESCQKLKAHLPKVTKIVDGFNIISNDRKMRTFQPSCHEGLSYYGWININTGNDYKLLLERFGSI